MSFGKITSVSRRYETYAKVLVAGRLSVTKNTCSYHSQGRYWETKDVRGRRKEIFRLKSADIVQIGRIFSRLISF